MDHHSHGEDEAQTPNLWSEDFVCYFSLLLCVLFLDVEEPKSEEQVLVLYGITKN